jgi:hypothetical protein
VQEDSRDLWADERCDELDDDVCDSFFCVCVFFFWFFFFWLSYISDRRNTSEFLSFHSRI